MQHLSNTDFSNLVLGRAINREVDEAVYNGGKSSSVRNVSLLNNPSSNKQWVVKLSSRYLRVDRPDETPAYQRAKNEFMFYQFLFKKQPSLKDRVCLQKEKQSYIPRLGSYSSSIDINLGNIGVVSCFLMVLENCGVNFEAYIHSQHNPLSLVEITELFHKMMCCLQYLQDNGILHGSLNPTNILIEPNTLELRIASFGRSRLLDSNGFYHPSKGEELYSEHFSPPEYEEGQPLSSKSDMWCLGKIIITAIFYLAKATVGGGLSPRKSEAERITTLSILSKHLHENRSNVKAVYKQLEREINWERNLDVIGFRPLVPILNKIFKTEPLRATVDEVLCDVRRLLDELQASNRREQLSSFDSASASQQNSILPPPSLHKQNYGSVDELSNPKPQSKSLDCCESLVKLILG